MFSFDQFIEKQLFFLILTMKKKVIGMLFQKKIQHILTKF